MLEQLDSVKQAATTALAATIVAPDPAATEKEAAKQEKLHVRCPSLVERTTHSLTGARVWCRRLRRLEGAPSRSAGSRARSRSKRNRSPL